MTIRREGTIGAAAFIAVLATIGISLQSERKTSESGRSPDVARKSHKSISSKNSKNQKPGCDSLMEQFRDFLDVDIPPDLECPGPRASDLVAFGSDIRERASDLKFVIALTPDPV